MSPSIDGVEAVTFDYWNTLVVPRNEEFRAARRTVIRDVLGPAGIEVEDDELERTFGWLVEQFNEHWGANRQFTGDDAAAAFLERHAPGLDEATATSFVAAFNASGADILPDLSPNVAGTVAALGEAGLRVGIICDVGMSPSTNLRRYLERHGVLDRFDHWSFSDDVGCYKPHAPIFEHALAGLGDVDPARTVHVGDLRRTDVAGAIEMGMTSVRYRALHDDTGGVGDVGELIEAHHVLDDHADLPPLLGLT